jgi:hypothetical protein
MFEAAIAQFLALMMSAGLAAWSALARRLAFVGPIPQKAGRNLARANTADLLKSLSLAVMAAGVIEPLLTGFDPKAAVDLASALAFPQAPNDEQLLGNLFVLITLVKLAACCGVAFALHGMGIKVAMMTEA